MSKLTWGELENRDYELGVDRGVFYENTGFGVPWNGLISVVESTIDSNETRVYIDGKMNRGTISLGSFAASLEAFTYPDEFEPYAGLSDFISGQKRTVFGLCYRTLTDTGYKIHLVYNILASPSLVANPTLNDSTDSMTFNWNLSTKPMAVEGGKPSAHLIIDSELPYDGVLEQLEDILYGTDDTIARLPSIQEVIDLFELNAIFRVTDHGDGSFTVTGPDDAVFMVDDSTFELSWPSVFMISDDTYQASSL